jgi:hypothetical protein
VSAAITAVETAATEALMKERMPAKAEPDAESRSTPLNVGTFYDTAAMSF